MSYCPADENQNSFTKDPDSNLDYAAIWTDWMAAGDTIIASTWVITPPGELVVGSNPASHTDDVATIWLAGGVLGKSYEAVNHITTVQGRIEDQTLFFDIVQH